MPIIPKPRGETFHTNNQTIKMFFFYILPKKELPVVLGNHIFTHVFVKHIQIKIRKLETNIGRFSENRIIYLPKKALRRARTVSTTDLTSITKNPENARVSHDFTPRAYLSIDVIYVPMKFARRVIYANNCPCPAAPRQLKRAANCHRDFGDAEGEEKAIRCTAAYQVMCVFLRACTYAELSHADSVPRWWFAAIENYSCDDVIRYVKMYCY